MKITLIHGNDTATSQKRFYKILDTIKKRGWEIKYINYDQSLSEQLTQSSLFDLNCLYVVDQINRLDQKDLEWLTKNKQKINANLLLFKDSEVPKATLSKLGKDIKIEQYTLPKIVFVFLESLFPKNCQKSLKLFHELLISEPVELIFSLICAHFRDLIWIKIASDSVSLPQWRKDKLSRQADKFSVDQLKTIIDNLVEIDIKSKKSQADLAQSIDVVLIRELQ